MTERSDQSTYSVEDRWRAPTLSGQDIFGDCEDFVLKKREMLLDAGVQEGVLAMALVRTPEGEPHAVLLVRTSEGEFVLDNRERRILPLFEAQLQIEQRQRTADVFDWVAASPEAARPTAAAR